ncbi:MAG: IS66 family transposase [Nitrosotalea sp.]
MARNIDAKPDRQNNVKKRNHKPGRKKGHEGKTRKKPDHIDARVVVDIKECSRCGSTLSKPTESYTRVVEDIIPARVIVTQYTIVRRYCRNCKRQVSCNVPDALSGEHFGLRLMAFIVSLKLLGLSYEKISDLFRTFFSLEITEAAINHAVVKVSEAFGSRYHEMLQELKTERNIHGDETSWRINGKNHWLWAFVSKWTVLYEIDKSRGSCVPERVLGDYDGCVTSDSWPAWNGVGGTHQRCHWHYINEIKDTFKYKNPGRQFRKFAKKLRRILYDSQRAGTVRSLKKRARAKKRFEERIGKLASCKYAEKNCVRLAKRLRREKGMLFTFLEQDGVEYHNNAAERAIRPCVVIRKITSGNKTVQGALAQAVLLSVKETCKKRSTNFYEYALDYLRSTSKS